MNYNYCWNAYLSIIYSWILRYLMIFRLWNKSEGMYPGPPNDYLGRPLNSNTYIFRNIPDEVNSLVPKCYQILSPTFSNSQLVFRWIGFSPQTKFYGYFQFRSFCVFSSFWSFNTDRNNGSKLFLFRIYIVRDAYNTIMRSKI